MSTDPPIKNLMEIAAKTRYPLDAFHFVRRGLDFTVHNIHANPEQMAEEQRHVSGKQLSVGLRDFAVDQYGLLARTVLARWGVTRTDDFGRIVFAMVDSGVMQATPADSVHDFENVYDFTDAFTQHIPLDRVTTPPAEKGDTKIELA
jgi:uncharacterized repeat protein (TIGR04138 family)